MDREPPRSRARDKGPLAAHARRAGKKPNAVALSSYAPYAGRLREAVGVPVIAVGKLGEPGVAQRVLDEGWADLVALARQLIADPRAAQKLLAGRDGEIERCQECLTCFAAIRKGPLKCSVNRAL